MIEKAPVRKINEGENGMKNLRNMFALIIFISIFSPPRGWAQVDILIDNSDPGFQLVGSGYWYTYHNPPWPSYGNDFRFNYSGTGEDQAVYTYDIPVSGYYEVYAWWPSHSVCSQNTPYTIPFFDGTVTIRVNQQQNPGQWNFLATGFFEQGQYQITISDNARNTVIVADAVRIVLVPLSNTAPILDPINNKMVNEGELLQFTVTASDPDGDDLTYSAINLPLGATFDPETQVFRWTPYWESSGEYKNIVFRVSDGEDYDEEIIIIGVIDKCPLETPTGLVAFNSGNYITLTWDPVSQSETLAGYNIYRSTEGTGNYEKVNVFSVTDTHYIDNNVESGTTYYYFVTAVDIFDHVELLSEGINYPLDIAFNSEGHLFVGSWIDGLVWTIDHDGSQSIYASGFGTASSLAFRNQDLFVTDYDGGPIYRITPDGEVYPYAESLILQEPGGLAFNANGELFVVEDSNGRILKISADGEDWEFFCEELNGPGDTAIDDSGNIYVGEDLWEGDIPVGVIDIIDRDKNKILFARLTDPDGIFLDQSGTLYVVQSYIDEVTRVMPDGSSMPAVILDSSPWGCGVNKFGELIVTLPWDGQIMKVHLSHETDISNKVTSSNNAPILDPIGSRTVKEGELLEFTVTASDPDDDLTYYADNLPLGAHFNPATQVFNWTPEYGQAGTYTDVLFTVIDDGDPPMSDSEEISIIVESSSPQVDIIIDNMDTGFSTRGEWYPFTGSYTYYGSNFVYNESGTGTDRALFTPDIPIAGTYEVFAWLETETTGATSCPYTIHHADGSTTIRVDLTDSANNGRWISLGIYRLNQGTSGTIVVSDDADGLYVVADAVRIVSIP